MFNLNIPGEINGTPVIEIADNGFTACPNLVRVKLPSSVKRVGTNAFANCQKLKKINLANVEVIGSNAFMACISLETVYIPDTCHTVGQTIFRNAKNTTHFVAFSVETIHNDPRHIHAYFNQ